MSAKCTSTLIIGGLEYKIQSSEIKKDSNINDILSAIVKEHGKKILKDIATIKEDVILNINDITNIKGNSSFADISTHMNSLGRQYIPIKEGMSILLRKLSKIVPVSEQNILWVSSPITLNGVKVPTINTSNNGDLVILDSNNIYSIYSTMKEYLYRKTINTPEKMAELLSFIGTAGKTIELGKRKSDAWINTLKGKFSEMRKNPATAIHYIVSDNTISELIDDLDLRGDLNRLLKTLSNVEVEDKTEKQWWLTWNESVGVYTNREGQTFRLDFKDFDSSIETHLKGKGIEASPEEIMEMKKVLLTGVSSGRSLSSNEIYNLWDEFTKEGCD